MMEPYGGSAFPIPEDESNLREEGMTLRDYFAAKAMQAEIVGNEGIYASEDSMNQVAELAYQMADAMLNVREQTK